MCPRSWAAVTPVKYKRDIQQLTYALTIVKNSENDGTEKISNPNPRTLGSIIMAVHLLLMNYVHVLLLTLVEKTENNYQLFPDSKVHGANMRPIWGRLDPGGPHVGPMNLAICVYMDLHMTTRLKVIPKITVGT